jgi:hypothetical protein
MSAGRPACGFQLSRPVMQKLQRRSHPLRAMASVGVKQEFIADLDLGLEHAGVLTRMAATGGAREAVHPTFMATQSAVHQGRVGGWNPGGGLMSATFSVETKQRRHAEGASSSRVGLVSTIWIAG